MWWDGGQTAQCADAVLANRQTMPERDRFPAVAEPGPLWIRAGEGFACTIHGKPAHDCECPPVHELGFDPYTEGGWVIRMVTPLEWERLQGMPDHHTRISWRGKPPEECPDGHRYRAIGNSMAVPVMRWIGERIQQIDAIEEAA